MSDFFRPASTAEIIAELNRIRARDYAEARARPEATYVEMLGSSAIAVLAMIHRWQGMHYLDYKMGVKTIREIMADGAGLRGSGALEKVIAELVGKGMVEVSKGGFLAARVMVKWSDSGSDRCYAYLNGWGWQLLTAALERHSLPRQGEAFGTGPPIVGGPGYVGWYQ